MPSRLNRREFVRTGAAAAGLGLAAPTQAAPAIRQARSKPVVISSANGNKYTHDGKETCVARAFRLMTEGTDVLEALIAGVNIVELDPLDTSVGYGGLPNADGVVQLDSCCMHGPKKRAGGVAALEGVRTPSRVAYAVMQQTDHHLLVGTGAQRFAQQMGHPIEADLNTDTSRRLWLEWKRRLDPEHFLDPEKRAQAGLDAGWSMVRDGLIDRDHYFGTINCDGVNAKGEVCGITTTSGLAWKIPGRVGDSPILGAGLYVDGEVGAAGSTGRGEANLYGLCSFLIVELLRQGKAPKDAGMEALGRVRANTIEKRLLDGKGNPKFGLQFYIVNKAGDFAAVSMYESEFAVCTENGPETRKCEALIPGKGDW
jgi:N4-(beta-N-acetylglucosaminyl)-L-asparaginase